MRHLGVTGAFRPRLVTAHTRRFTMWLGQQHLMRRIVKHHATHFGTPGATRRPLRRLLFVCRGNICRSPFAERLARARLDGCTVESAGVGATPNRPSPEHLVRIARGMGVDLEDRRSTRLGAAQVARADLILAMDPENYARLAAEFPEAVAKMTLLGLFAREARPVIPDPYTGSEIEVRDVLEQIREAVDGLSSWLHGDAEKTSREPLDVQGPGSPTQPNPAARVRKGSQAPLRHR
jgi:protein-tyrosine-phosphatase